jgi:hypothetical protein
MANTEHCSGQSACVLTIIGFASQNNVLGVLGEFKKHNNCFIKPFDTCVKKSCGSNFSAREQNAAC